MLTVAIYVFKYKVFFYQLIQNNQAELQQLKDYHQQEIASLQGTYTKRISIMNKKHQSELEDLMSENERLSDQIKEYETVIGK